MTSRTEFLICQRLKPLNPMRDVIMTLEGDYRVKFEAIPSETAIAELEFQIIRQDGKHFTLRDLRPITHPVLMNESEAAVHERLTAHYGHIGSVSASADRGFVVQLMGGVIDKAFLDDVTRKTGLQVINHNGSSFTVRSDSRDAAPASDDPLPTFDEPPVTSDDTREVEPVDAPVIIGLYPQPAQVDHLIAALEAEPDADAFYAAQERETEARLDAEQDEREVQQFFDDHGVEPDGYMRPCEDCDGTGTEANGDYVRPCSTCGGTGIHTDASDAATLDHALDTMLQREGIELPPSIDAGDAPETDDTAWATPGLRAALDAVLAVHEFYPAEIHPTAATHHWLIENRGRKEYLRGRLESAGLAVVYVTQDYIDDAPYSLATIHFDGTPDLVRPLDEDAAASDTLADLRTCVSLLSGMNSLLEGRLAEAHAINQAQSNLIRDAILPTFDVKLPRRVDVMTIIQDIDNFEEDDRLANLRNVGWLVASETVNTYVDDFTDGFSRVKHIRIIRLESDLPTPQPQPDLHASVEVDALLGHLPRNGAPAPAPRPGARVIIEQAVPLGNPILNGLPIAQALRRDGLDAVKQAAHAYVKEVAVEDFRSQIADIQSRPLLALPTRS